MENEDVTALVTASYTIPADLKARIEQTAIKQDLNASQVVRRILREHYNRADATTQTAPAETAASVGA